MKTFFFIIVMSLKLYSSPIEILTFNYPPLQGKSEFNKIGLIPEVIEAAFKENNIKVVFKELPAQRGIEEIKKGNNLAMVSVIENFDKETQKNLVFFPVLHMDFLVFYDKKRVLNFKYKKDSDLSQYNIGVILNGSTHTYAKSKKLNVEGVISLEAMFKKVDLGRNELCIAEYLSGLNTIKILFPNRKNDWVAYTENPFLSTIGGVVFNKKHKNYKVYAPLFQDGLIKIIKNGKWEKIVKKYYPNNKINPKSIELMKNFINK